MSNPGSATTQTVDLKFVLHVPDSLTSAVYITGSAPEFGPWNPGKVLMDGTGSERTFHLRAEKGKSLEYKFTLGSWENEIIDEQGFALDNFEVRADRSKTVQHTATKFGRGKHRPPQGVTGYLGITGQTRLFPAVRSVRLSLPRDVIVLLPPDYEKDTSKRYSVLYMHDGQNLFDPKTSFVGVDWGIDEALDELIKLHKVEPLIVVGIYNTPKRTEELDPEAEGDNYARFLVEELKPMIDKEFRTFPDAAHTGVGGSSLGGLISMYIGWKYPQTFSKIAAVSVHLQLHDSKLINDIETSGSFPKTARVYMDYGTKGIDADYEPYVKRMAGLLKKWGWIEGKNLMVYKAVGETHSEVAWRKRVKIPLQFLFGDTHARR